LRDATVFYTVYGSVEEQAATAAALASATGLIRIEVGRQIGIKHISSITFEQDKLPEGARSIEDLVIKVRQDDVWLAAVRADAVPVGDPDLYREANRQQDDES